MHYQEELKNTEGQQLVSTDLLAKCCWDAYKESVGGKAWNGDALPTWDEMKADESKQGLVEAWKRGSFAVVHCYELHRIKPIIESGNAGCLPNGNIVDRRVHPEAVPIPR